MSSKKLVLLAHGSSSLEWSGAFESMTAQIRQQNEHAVIAFMELSSPSLQEVCAEAKSAGYQSIQVLPLFLAIGRHLKKDVPAMIAQYSQELDIDIELLAPIGQHPALSAAITQIASEYID